MAKGGITGLPPTFSIGVTGADLAGPVTLAGYLDDDPVVTAAKQAQERLRAERLSAELRGPSITPPTPAAAPSRTEAVGEVSGEREKLTVTPPPVTPVIERKDPVPQTPITSSDPIIRGVPFGTAEKKAEQSVAARPVAMPQSVAAPVSANRVEEKESAPTPRVKRMQVNLSAETERMMHELIEQVSAESGEKRILFADMMQALVTTLYEARGDLDVSMLPERGRWGAPTAKAFRTALSHACREAIVEYSQKLGDPFKKAAAG